MNELTQNVLFDTGTMPVFDAAASRAMPFDVCAKNHGGNEMSREANLRTDKQHDIARILKFMRSKPETETYVKEIIRELGLKHQTASARLSDLKAAGVVEPTTKRAEGCGVVRLRK